MATPRAMSRLPALIGPGRDRTGRGSERGRGTGGGAASRFCPQTLTLRGKPESEASAPCSASHFLVAKATHAPCSENAATQTESAATPFLRDQSALSLPSAGPPGKRRRKKWSWSGPRGSLDPQLLASGPAPQAGPESQTSLHHDEEEETLLGPHDGAFLDGRNFLNCHFSLVSIETDFHH